MAQVPPPRNQDTEKGSTKPAAATTNDTGTQTVNTNQSSKPTVTNTTSAAKVVKTPAPPVRGPELNLRPDPLREF
uniref:Uncharacterized protein n=1 Tax=Trichobilharzia regenti TaxID=157069 RepID=A0AA85J5D5_TRIRE|nr:unnamed protein product [Trichobilharzia regenti]